MEWGGGVTGDPEGENGAVYGGERGGPVAGGEDARGWGALPHQEHNTEKTPVECAEERGEDGKRGGMREERGKREEKGGGGEGREEGGERGGE